MDKKDYCNKKQTKCLKCAKVGKSICSWDASRGEIPVEGWTAIPDQMLVPSKGYVQTYCVLDCPLFEEDKPRQEETLSDEQLQKWLKRGFSDAYIAGKCGLPLYIVRWRRLKLMLGVKDDK
jgi:hypothetical protein